MGGRLLVATALAGVCLAAPQIAWSAGGGQTSQLNTRVAKLESEVSDLKTTLRLIEWIGGIVLGGGVLIGFAVQVRTERRTGQLHELAVQGESAAQARAEQTHAALLESSQKTLNLVNDTLGLAKEASERASQTLTRRAQYNVDRLDAEAQEVLRPALVGSHFKVLVERPERQRDLFEVASELAAIEGYLEFQDVQLTAPCLFVRGMERYIHQEPRAAIRYFRQALRAATAIRDRDLTALVLFWLGYQLNNLGTFDEAIDNFRRAEDFVDHGTARHLELRRIGQETRVFQLAQEVLRGRDSTSSEPSFARRVETATRGVENLNTLERLATEGGSDFEDVLRAILQTRANVRVWIAYQYAILPGGGAEAQAGDGLEEAELTQAVTDFAVAGGAVVETEVASGLTMRPADVERISLWPYFGLLEAKYRLFEMTESPDWSVSADDYALVVEKAVDQLSVRAEPRTLASLNETRLIAEARRAELADSALEHDRDREEAYKATMTALNQVDRDVYLFSQRLKVNVPWEVFEGEVKSFNRGQRDRTQLSEA
jgi:tetratricopeptide (TPR) repeat protein